ncbi:hypothetical protein [Paraflavitalea sp. CAU 1676]|uniref:hypothetical protein n=1 Tax=Paraflavitalea sp. CAU 1676 TaxID=3032598 RepID=UPI0023DC522B|nr:hypothetical protein [Paraflavitalea sp. CAU 1676]MDF2189846.1 hypothetical protein [Paraflavitalea sp. CAU 1676]
MAEMAFEAVICAKAINEYAKVYGQPLAVTPPVQFLNQKPGRFDPAKAFKVQFPTTTFYFATDVECYGLAAMGTKGPAGDIFEADVVVIEESHVSEILNQFGGLPAPQHLNAAYECKFGAYHKSQLRELLGFRRHLSYLNTPSGNNHPLGFPFGLAVNNADPSVQIILFRPTNLSFLTPQTADLYNLYQEVYP